MVRVIVYYDCGLCASVRDCICKMCGGLYGGCMYHVWEVVFVLCEVRCVCVCVCVCVRACVCVCVCVCVFLLYLL